MPARADRTRRVASGERGFALISALWLLLLGGSLAALLTLRAVASARDLAFDDRRHAAASAADDAVETVAADLLFRGQASMWGRPPASGSVTVDGARLSVATQAEGALADVNAADAATLDRTLAGFAAPARAALVARILAARAAGHRIASLAEAAALGRGILPAGEEPCLAALLSPYAAASGGTLGVGSLVRITTGTGIARQAFVLRLVAANDRPYALLDAYVEACPLAMGQAA